MASKLPRSAAVCFLLMRPVFRTLALEALLLGARRVNCAGSSDIRSAETSQEYVISV